MEKKDMELIQKYLDQDTVLEKLYQAHLDYSRRLEKLDSRPYLTPDEELERKKIQKLKLKGRDDMETLLKKYRECV